MRAFYFENNNNLSIEPSSQTLIGGIDLPPGQFVVWAKLSVIVTGTPDPSSTKLQSGEATLVYGNGSDQTSTILNLNYDRSSENLSLMTLAKSGRQRWSRLYYINLGPDLVAHIYNVRMVALELENSVSNILGADSIIVPDDEEERLREAQFSAQFMDVSLKL